MQPSLSHRKFFTRDAGDLGLRGAELASKANVRQTGLGQNGVSVGETAVSWMRIGSI